MTTPPSIHRIMELQKLLLAFGRIERACYLPAPDEKHENDVEHSYFLAMIAWFLAPHFPQLDAAKMIRLALAHDLVEVYSGDTFVWGDKNIWTQKPNANKQPAENSVVNGQTFRKCLLP